MTARRRRSSRSPGSGPGTTTPTVTDMVPGIEIYDPLFSVARDPGRRELPDRDQPDRRASRPARGCCSARRPRRQFAPTKTLPNNTYYWRVRGVDPQGQAGPWNNGPAFTKTYDETPLPGPPNLTVYNSKLDADRRRRQRQRARRHLEHGARRAQLRGADELQRQRDDLLHGEHRVDAARLDRLGGAVPYSLQRAPDGRLRPGRSAVA